ncbi:MAG: hypothetical protein K0R66_450 [Gammaproteobacteria bacterium]|jgi:hypothetical protein|nr:hypothetical protein [Gammaproteobacteria bacterium]
MPSAKILILSKQDINYPSFFRPILPEGSNLPLRTGQIINTRPFNIQGQEATAQILSDCWQLYRTSLSRSHYLDTDAIIIWTDLANNEIEFIRQKLNQLKEDLKPGLNSNEIPFCEAKVFILPFHNPAQNIITSAQKIQQTWSEIINEPGFERVRALDWKVLEPVNPFHEESIRARFQFILQQSLVANHSNQLSPGPFQLNEAARTSFSELQRRASSTWGAVTSFLKPSP